MRILQFIDTPGPGGAEDVFVELAAGCVGAGHECVALVPGNGWISEALDRRGVRTEITAPTGSFSFGFLRDILRVVRRHRIEVIHSHLFGASIYAAVASRLASVPLVATFHGTVDVPPSLRLVRIKAAAVRNADRLVAVSDQLRDYLLKPLGLTPDRMDVIPNGIETERFLHAEPADLRGPHNIGKQAFIIGSVGNIRAPKAYLTGIRSLRLLRDDGTDAHWFIAGQPDESGEIMASLQAEAKRLGVAEFVHFLGFVPRPERFLAALDCYLLSSDSEGHPLALCQAMTSGRPVVATRCGVEAFLEDGRNALLVPVGAPREMATALRAVHADPISSACRVERARRHALEFFDRAISLGRYLKIYQALVSRRR